MIAGGAATNHERMVCMICSSVRVSAHTAERQAGEGCESRESMAKLLMLVLFVPLLLLGGALAEEKPATLDPAPAEVRTEQESDNMALCGSTSMYLLLTHTYVYVVANQIMQKWENLITFVIRGATLKFSQNTYCCTSPDWYPIQESDPHQSGPRGGIHPLRRNITVCTVVPPLQQGF